MDGHKLTMPPGIGKTKPRLTVRKGVPSGWGRWECGMPDDKWYQRGHGVSPLQAFNDWLRRRKGDGNL